MNWVGGARSRVKAKDSKKQQREFFERRRFQAHLTNVQYTPVKNTDEATSATSSRPIAFPFKRTSNLSQDIIYLETLMRNQDLNQKDRKSPKVIHVDMERPRPGILNSQFKQVELPESPSPEVDSSLTLFNPPGRFDDEAPPTPDVITKPQPTNAEIINATPQMQLETPMNSTQYRQSDSHSTKDHIEPERLTSYCQTPIAEVVMKETPPSMTTFETPQTQIMQSQYAYPMYPRRPKINATPYSKYKRPRVETPMPSSYVSSFGHGNNDETEGNGNYEWDEEADKDAYSMVDESDSAANYQIEHQELAFNSKAGFSTPSDVTSMIRTVYSTSPRWKENCLQEDQEYEADEDDEEPYTASGNKRKFLVRRINAETQMEKRFKTRNIQTQTDLSIF